MLLTLCLVLKSSLSSIFQGRVFSWCLRMWWLLRGRLTKSPQLQSQPGGSVESVIQGRLEDCLLYSTAVRWIQTPFQILFFFFITIGKRVAYYQIRTGVGCRVGKKGEGTWTKSLLLIFSRTQIPGEGCFLFRREAGKGTWAPAV